LGILTSAIDSLGSLAEGIDQDERPARRAA